MHSEVNPSTPQYKCPGLPSTRDFGESVDPGVLEELS